MLLIAGWNALELFTTEAFLPPNNIFFVYVLFDLFEIYISYVLEMQSDKFTMPAASCMVDRNFNRMQKQLITEMQTGFSLHAWHARYSRRCSPFR